MNTAQIETLCCDLGPNAAEDVVCRAMEELALRLCIIEQQADAGPREDMHKGLKALAAIADQIGLSTLSRVAHDVMACIVYGDRVAEAATTGAAGPHRRTLIDRTLGHQRLFSVTPCGCRRRG
ncbi:hypothetical protein [Ponticoccus litoralis]|uniref:Uncharacterized protein n=1 Tax=Ponticoccus litoralis TaxID=422297 RepID=A0AAW9SLT4_9RHOB